MNNAQIFVYKIRISVQDPNLFERDLNLCEQDDALYEQDRDCKNIYSVLMFCMMGFLGVTATQDIKICCNTLNGDFFGER